MILVLFIGFPRKYNNQEEENNRISRREHLNSKHTWTANRNNPLNWIIYWTYVRTGNPFRKTYRNEWLNIIIIFGLLLLPIQLLINYQTMLSQYTLIYLIIYGWLLIFSGS